MEENSEAENSSVDLPVITVSCFVLLSSILWHYTPIDNLIGNLSVLNVFISKLTQNIPFVCVFYTIFRERNCLFDRELTLEGVLR